MRLHYDARSAVAGLPGVAVLLAPLSLFRFIFVPATSASINPAAHVACNPQGCSLLHDSGGLKAGPAGKRPGAPRRLRRQASVKALRVLP